MSESNSWAAGKDIIEYILLILCIFLTYPAATLSIKIVNPTVKPSALKDIQGNKYFH